ncbi:MAG: hypothetical protein LBD97_02475 [Bifidobacteriaceae bacterium]|jgi:signal transduction histidine kinase|nr:hypothetical protein [Bifidobacteriaceae bacterium]
MTSTVKPHQNVFPKPTKANSSFGEVMRARASWDGQLASMIRGLAGVVAVCCLVMSIVNGALGLGPMPVILNLLIPVVVLLSVLYIEATDRFLGAYVVIIVAVFLVLLPLGFFTSGGGAGTVPYYFLTGVALTSFMLQGWWFVVAFTAELVVFTACLTVTLYHPEYLQPEPDHQGLEISQPIGLACAAVVIALSVQFVYHHYVQTAAQLNQSNAALLDAAHNKDAFLALLAHELKTPVAIMSSHAQEAARVLGALEYQTPDAIRVRADMATILRQSVSLSGMVTQLLDINRINDGRLVFKMARVSLAQVVQETLAECGQLLGDDGNQLRLASGGAHPTVIADAGRINRVLLNLISNASRHTHHGSITVTLSKDGAFARVSVADTGEGMTAAQIDRILTTETVGGLGLYDGTIAQTLTRAGRRLAPAHDADPPSESPSHRPHGETEEDAGTRLSLPVASGSRHGGLGLGLRIVRHTVAAHGGEFEITSELGRGTTASFTIPLAPQASPPWES